MASYPTYNPSIYSGHVTTKRLAAQGLTPSTAEQHNYPTLDRAIDGVYPAGSTFKPVTALAAMETGNLLALDVDPVHGLLQRPKRVPRRRSAGVPQRRPLRQRAR